MQNFANWFNTNEAAEHYAAELFATLRGDSDPNLWVHFTQTPKFGVNPKPTHGDPAGIYAFPKKYVLSNQINANHMFVGYPYAYIFKLKPNTRILNLHTTTNSQADDFIKRYDANPEKSLLYSSRDAEKPGGRLWHALQSLKGGTYKSHGLNKKLRDMNYDAVYDEDGIIHSNEKEQILILTPSVCEIVKFIQLGNMTDRIKKLAWQFMSLVAQNLYGSNNYQVRSSKRYSERVIYANGNYNDKRMIMWFTYYLNNDRSDRHLYGTVNISSNEIIRDYSLDLKQSVEVRAETEMDLETEAKKVSDYFKEKLKSATFREPKDEKVAKLANEVAKIFGYTKPPLIQQERAEITRNYKLGHVNINMRYSDYDGNYSLTIVLKTVDPFGAQIAGSSEMDDPITRQMVEEALKDVEAKIYEHYNPDPDKHPQSWKFDAPWRGQKLIKLLNFVKAKVT